jgi:hypothetical protein
MAISRRRVRNRVLYVARIKVALEKIDKFSDLQVTIRAPAQFGHQLAKGDLLAISTLKRLSQDHGIYGRQPEVPEESRIALDRVKVDAPVEVGKQHTDFVEDRVR